jgi:transposase
MLRCVRIDGLPVSRAAQRFGFSRPTFYKARAAFERDGLPGLLPAKPGPHTAHKLSPEVMAFIRELLDGEPSLTASELAERLRDRLDLLVHPRSIERALARDQEKGRLMTSPDSSPASNSEDAGELARSYERLRMDALERRRISSVGAGVGVLHRQGMPAWVSLHRAKPRTRRSPRKPVAQASRVPVRSELLSTLTDLVFQTWALRSSS